MKIEKLGDNISDSAFQTRLLSSLPRQFGSFISATHLSKDIKLQELILALTSEDLRLKQINAEKKKIRERSKTNSNSVAIVCYICQKSDNHKSQECRFRKSSTNTTQKLTNSSDKNT